MVTNDGGCVERRRRCVIENDSARPAVAPYPNSIVPAQVFLSSGFGFRMESSLSKGLEVKGGGFSLYACDAPCTAPCDDGRSIAGD